MTAFDKHQVTCFRFVRCRLDPATGVVELVYAFDEGASVLRHGDAAMLERLCG